MEEALAAGPRLRAVLRVPRRRVELLVPRPDPRQPPDRAAGDAREGYHIAKDLSDKAIRFIRDAKVVDPDKPFFLYFSLDAAHAPHHVFKEWADKYKGTFDYGYEAIRESILARQKELGLLPDDTELTASTRTASRGHGPDGQPWPLLDTVRPWESLSDDEKRLFIRMAEVFAGYVEYTDDQVGRNKTPNEATAAGHAPRAGPADRRTAGRDLGTARWHPQTVDPPADQTEATSSAAATPS